MDLQISPLSGAKGAPLGQLCSELSQHLVTPFGDFTSDTTITGVEYFDSCDAVDILPGTLVLLPSGGALAPHELNEITARLAAAGAGALAMKCTSEVAETLTALSAAHRIPVLRVNEQIPWRVFDASVSRLGITHPFEQNSHAATALTEFTELTDRGAEPLFAIANELATEFGGSVAIEDLGRRVIAYSAVPGQLIDEVRTEGILSRRVPDSPLNDDQYRTVLRSAGPVCSAQQGAEAPRIAMGVLAGSLPLGTIWIINAHADPNAATHTITPAQETRIRKAAQLAAAHLLNSLRSNSVSRRQREDRFSTLLDGVSITGSELAELGLSEECGAALLAFEPGSSAQPMMISQLHSLVQRHLSLHRPEVVTAVRDGRVFALISDRQIPSGRSRPDAEEASRADGQVPADARELLEPLIPVIDRLIGPGTRTALPGVAHRSAEVTGLRHLAARLFAAPSRALILTVPEVRPLLLFQQLTDAMRAAPELRDPAVDELVASSPVAAHTLASWCSHQGNVARTARDLGVHENTVRHRLQQIEQNSGIRIATADELLTVWLQLRLSQLTTEPGTHRVSQQRGHLA